MDRAESRSSSGFSAQNELNIVGQYATTIAGIFAAVQSNYNLNCSILVQANEEINDLLHEIELSALKSAREGYFIYEELREARIRRRKAKEENELLQELYEFLQNQSGFKNQLSKIHANSVKLFDLLSRRTYKPRQRTDLTIAENSDKPYKPFEEMLSAFKETEIRSHGGKLRK